MGIQDLAPANTAKAKATAIKAFTRFVTDENVTMKYIHEQFSCDPSGGSIERVLDKFGAYLAFLDTKNGKLLARNTVMSYYRHVKLWLIDLYKLSTDLATKLLKMGTTLDRYCLKRSTGGFVKKAPACTKDHLRTLMVYQYSMARSSTDYQDAALLCLLWYLFGRASDLSSLQKCNLTVTSGSVLFVRLMRMKTADEQGLSLYYDESFLACPLTAMAAAIVMQSTPQAALLGHLPVGQDHVRPEQLPSIALIDVIHACVQEGSMASNGAVHGSTSAALPGVHSHVNRLLNRICKPAGVIADLTSHSFRRGGAQHANGSCELSPQWIFDRGSWNMTATNKAFAYVFNTSNEDQKVARVLSSWPATANIVPPTFDVFDTSTKADVSRMQGILFASSIGLQNCKYNICDDVVTLLMVYLVRSYPMFKKLQPMAPLVSKIEQAAKSAGVDLEAVVAWATMLRNRKVQKEDATELSTMSSFAEQQTEMIDALTRQNQRLLARIHNVEMQLATTAAEVVSTPHAADSSKGAKRAVEQHENADEPVAKRRGEAVAPSTMWYEWFTLQPRPWGQTNRFGRQRRSDMKLLVDFMRLFVEGAYYLDEDSESYRDDVLKLGKSAELNLRLFLSEKGLQAKAGGASLKKLRELHSRGELNDRIERFNSMFRSGLVQDPSPSATINQLRQCEVAR